MKAIVKLFGAIVLAATLSISCQKEIQTDIDTPVEQEVYGIPVTVNAGIVDTKSAVVYEGGVRTLNFTLGDKLLVSASLELDLGEGPVDCMLSGELDIDTIDTDGTTATFSGDLDLYKYSFPQLEQITYNFGTDNPLDLCDQAQALLVHEGTTVSGGVMGTGYNQQMASTVEELMTTCLNVSGTYDTTNHSFSLSTNRGSQITPIFNCTINGLTANTEYQVYLLMGSSIDDASGDRMLGSVTSDAYGNVAFACYTTASSTEPRYYAFRFKNGNDWMRAELGSKTLASKVYNITRTASADPASPIKPTVTGDDGQWNSDLSVYYNDGADFTISGISKGYYFRIYGRGTVHLNNLSASYHVNPFLYSPTDMNIELTGDNSIVTKGQSCISSFGDVKLSCTGTSATLSVTYDGYGLWGIEADNYSHEPLSGGAGTNPAIVSDQDVPELAADGYKVSLTTTQNTDGTWTTVYTVVPVYRLYVLDSKVATGNNTGWGTDRTIWYSNDASNIAKEGTKTIGTSTYNYFTLTNDVVGSTIDVYYKGENNCETKITLTVSSATHDYYFRTDGINVLAVTTPASPEEFPATASRIYVRSSVTDLKCHMWGGATQTTWPGNAFTATSAKQYGDLWYYVEIPDGTTSFIINSPGGDWQTSNLTLSAYAAGDGNYYMYCYGSDPTQVTW